jgi:flagellar hook assembly protein FlgD
VVIAVYDVKGARVRTLVDEVQAPSTYVVKWDGRSDAGRKLASGVYFVRYQAGSHSFTKKAVLLR